jgi:DNA polymerase alpha subunit A
VKVDDDVYDDLDEDQYQDLVRKRREDNFIEDDDGNGYVDFGQDDWDDEAYSGDEEPMSKRAKADGGERKRGVFNNLAPKKKKATERVNSMFLGAGRDVIGPGKVGAGKGKAGEDDGGDELLSSLLGEIESDPMGTKVKPQRSQWGRQTAAAASIAAARPAMPMYRPNSRVPSVPASSSGAGGAEDTLDYRRAPPKLDAADLFDEPAPPKPDAVPVGASSLAGDGSAPAEAADETAMAMEVDVSAAGGAPGVADAEASAVARAMPFMAAEETGSGVDWFQVCDEEQPSGSQAAAAASSQPTSQPLASSGGGPPLDEDGNLLFYWFDAYEDSLNAPGSVVLFGKVKNESGGYSSCCAALKGLERNVYVLPRTRALVDGQEIGDEVEFLQVYKEVQTLCRNNRITRFGCKKVDRSYAFEDPSVPPHSSYLKLVYSAELPALPFDTTGTYFSKCFGTQTSCLERLLLKRKVMGPCWLKLSGAVPSTSSASWCKFEVNLPQGKKAVTVLEDPPPSPPLVVASLHVQTAQNSKHVPEVLMASVITHQGVSIDGATTNPTALSACSVVRKPEGHSWPWDLQRTVSSDKRIKLEICATERALLNYLIARLHSIDADVIVGHNIAAFDIAVLLQRLSVCKVAHWSKLGRMRIKNMPKLSGSNSAFSGSNWAEWSVVAGRLMCDTYLSSRELLPSQRSYGLKELSRTHLDANKPEIEQAALIGMFEETQSLLQLVRYNENDAFLSLQLMFKLMVLPLTKQLTNLAGNLWTKSLQGKRAERIEYLLLHEFHRLKYVAPDKETYKMKLAKKNAKAAREEDEEDAVAADDDDDGGNRRGNGQSGRKKPAYAGGLVLEPKRGFYDKYVLLLDFNSLYPSIVQEYNICFTTVKRPTADEEGNMPLAELPSGSLDTGVLPRLIGMLVARRREVKALLKSATDPSRKTQLDIRQKALKIMANSMYGCLGFSGSRFYARALAELITSRGRDALQHAVEMAANNNMEVIYGDTDSVMVHSATDDLVTARKMADALKREVNKHYKCMEIDIDGVMQSMLLLKKKKYAALMVEEKNGELVTTRETKGLDLVRRDWCTLSREVGSTVLDFILSGLPREELVSKILEFLRDVAARVAQNELGIEQYIITKALTKAPHDYPDAKSQPHVQVAKAMLEQGQTVAPGAVIEYVICVDPGKSSVAERAYHPKTVLKAEGLLQIDTAWYLGQQLHPPIWRLCEPIEGLDSAQIAESLGLDPAKFANFSALDAGARDELQLPGGSAELAKFAQSKPLRVKCAECNATHSFRGILGQGDVGSTGTLGAGGEWLGAKALRCAGCSATYDKTRLQNALSLAVRKEVTAYYTASLQCDEPSCCESSHGLSTHIARDEAGMPLFPACTVPRCKGRMMKTYTDKALHTQLLFFKSLFDHQWSLDKLAQDNKRRAEKIIPSALAPDEIATFRALTAQAEAELTRSAFHVVDLGSLFATPSASGAATAEAGPSAA